MQLCHVNQTIKNLKRKKKKNEYIIDIDLPGYDKEGIKLEIQDGYLTVHASVNKEENEGKGIYSDGFRL